MKKVFAVFAIVGLLLANVIPVFAADQTADFFKSITGSGQVTGPCHVLGVNLYGASAGDTIGLYDYSAATNSGNGSPLTASVAKDIEFEMGVSANKSSVYADLKGMPFVYGVYVLASVSTTYTTVLFDY